MTDPIYIPGKRPSNVNTGTEDNSNQNLGLSHTLTNSKELLPTGHLWTQFMGECSMPHYQDRDIQPDSAPGQT